MDYSFFEEIPQNIFTHIQEIGSGTFSDIFSAVHLNTNTKVALKVSLKNQDEKDKKFLKQEVNISKSLHHPFICKYFTDIETDHLNIIVMELIEGTNALAYVNKTHGLPIQEALNIFTQLIIAMEYLHNEAHIAHRDLKLENIMIDKFNHIRLIDFGFSSTNSMMSTCCGSIPYCAPEVLTGKKYTKAADIWSLGVILYALIGGHLPFYHSNINTLAAMIIYNDVKFTTNFPDLQIQNLIKRMLIKDPEQRITIDEIKKHPSLAQQKLLQINYKQLFQSYQENSISLSSQKVNDNQTTYAKSSTCIEFGNSSKHYPLLKEFPSSDTKVSHINLKANNDSEGSSKLDELIKMRKNFAVNLNKLIETTISNSFPQKNILLHAAISNNLGSNLGRRRIYCRKRSNRCIFKNASPLLQPNVNNAKII